MGEMQAQEKKKLFSPERRELAGRIFRKALPALTFAAGLSIGLGVWYADASWERLRRHGCEERELHLEREDRAYRQKEMLKRELVQAVVSNAGDTEEVQFAIRNIDFILDSGKLESGKEELLRKFIRDSDKNIVNSIAMLTIFVSSTDYKTEQLTEQNLDLITETADLLATKVGDEKKEVFGAFYTAILQESIYMNAGNAEMNPLPPLKRIEVVRVIAEHSEDAEDMKGKAGIVGSALRRGVLEGDFVALAKEIVGLLNMVEARSHENNTKEKLVEMLEGRLRSRHYISEWKKRVETFREKTNPAGVVEAVKALREKLPNEQDFSAALGMLRNIARNFEIEDSVGRKLAEKLCSLFDAIALEEGHREEKVEILFRLLDGKYSAQVLQNPETVDKIRETIDTAARKAGENSGEAVGVVKSLIEKTLQQPDCALLDDFLESVSLLAERTRDQERFIHNLHLLAFHGGRRVPGNADMKQPAANATIFAQRLCDLEDRAYERGGKAGLRALDELYDGGARPAVVRLAEAAMGELQGGAAINAINSLRRILHSEEGPFYCTGGGCMTQMGEMEYEDVERAEELMKSIYRTDRPNIERLINFAYGVHAVGAEKTRELYNRFGIEYFYRYGTEILREVSINSDPMNASQGPLLLAVFGKSDWNNAFYESAYLGSLKGHYRIMIAEAAHDVVLYSKIREVCGQYGRISALVGSGHGSPRSIMLGDSGGRFGFLDMMDETRLMMLRDCFVEQPVIVLNSCSTGESGAAIGGMLSRVLGARVFAPVRPAILEGYVVDEEGWIIGARYETPTREYTPNGGSRIVQADTP